jgi:hypothetical protein
MHGIYTGLSWAKWATPICSVLLSTACSTPQHTNTLIFGTTTRVAIDASQEPTGALGVTIGYKRNEAVWMPLLANQSKDGEQVPSRCKTDACRSFEGTTGAGGAAGANALDTYSVLATFTGNAGVSAANPQANTTLAQYFATGFAARLLAQYGGAAVVNSGAEPAAVSAEVAKFVNAKRVQVLTIGAKISKTNGDVDSGKLDTLLRSSPASGLDTTTQNTLKTITKRTEFEEHLLYGPEQVLDSLYKSIDQL